MKTSKRHIYLVPGLAANTSIFKYLKFPKNQFEVHFIDWLIPTSSQETIKDYAKRMAALVTEENSVLIGVSFGGIMVQEMSNYLKLNKLIIISSVKCRNELPKRLKVIQKTKAYKIIPTKVIANIENFSMLAFGEFAKKRIKLYNEYLSVRDETYLSWAIENVLNWNRTKPIENVVHIHGTNDHIFPINHIQNCIPIENGTHIMILNKAKTISKIIIDNL
jgi:pimeloyl-ACP methyl ester carboxylesterase